MKNRYENDYDTNLGRWHLANFKLAMIFFPSMVVLMKFKEFSKPFIDELVGISMTYLHLLL